MEDTHGAVIGTFNPLNLEAGQTISPGNVWFVGDNADLFEISASFELKLKDDVTIDFETLNDNSITIRNRDTMKQVIWGNRNVFRILYVILLELWQQEDFQRKMEVLQILILP